MMSTSSVKSFFSILFAGVSALTGFYFGREFLFYYRISKVLRNQTGLQNITEYTRNDVGKYVLVKGKATQLKSGKTGLAKSRITKTECLVYETTTWRLLDKVTRVTGSYGSRLGTMMSYDLTRRYRAIVNAGSESYLGK